MDGILGTDRAALPFSTGVYTDPAGRDDEAYAACAAELWALCGALVRRL
jgi:hypothetical protein